MSLGATCRLRSELCSGIVCIDSFDEYNMTGRLFHNSLSHELYFRSFMELVEQMEHIFNSLDYPQKSMELRAFPGTQPLEREKVRAANSSLTHSPSAKGDVATFQLRVMFRQNASWQGTVRWVEQGVSENFRSVLELLHLIDSAIPIEHKEIEPDTQAEAI